MTAVHIHDERRPMNYARSAFHVTSAVIGLLLAEYAPWWLVVAVPVSLASLFWFLEAARRVSDAWNDALVRFFRHIIHPHERFRVNSSTWYATALSILSLSGQPLVFASGVMVLGIGDPLAAIVGRKFGRVELVNHRTLEGSATFLVASFLTVLAVIGLWHSDLDGLTIFVVCSTASIAGTLTELFSRRVDDNFSIPVVTGAAVWAVLALLGL